MNNDNMNGGGRPGGDMNGGQQQQKQHGGDRQQPPNDQHMGKGGNNQVIGSAALRPVFLGNLSNSYTSSDIMELFERPINPPNGNFKPVLVDRVDLKRGYCFVFLKDATSEDDKDNVERFVSDINGMEVRNVSNALRAEFARGDGRVKRKEDDRRKLIQPSETLFVVNFHEQTTKREDLRMLFEPYGELVRIEMKRNYAFVQFRTIEQATMAKEEVNGGKLDQSVLTVEYVAQHRGDNDRRRGGDFQRRPYNERRRDHSRGPPRYDDRRRSPPRDRYHDDHRDRDYDRRRSPPRRGRSRSRSRSPPYHRSKSPRRDNHFHNDRFSGPSQGMGSNGGSMGMGERMGGGGGGGGGNFGNDRGGKYDDRDYGRGDRDYGRGDRDYSRGDRDRGDRGYRP